MTPISDALVGEIIRRVRAGEAKTAVAKDLGLSRSTVCRVMSPKLRPKPKPRPKAAAPKPPKVPKPKAPASEPNPIYALYLANEKTRDGMPEGTVDRSALEAPKPVADMTWELAPSGELWIDVDRKGLRYTLILMPERNSKGERTWHLDAWSKVEARGLGATVSRAARSRAIWEESEQSVQN